MLEFCTPPESAYTGKPPDTQGVPTATTAIRASIQVTDNGTYCWTAGDPELIAAIRQMPRRQWDRRRVAWAVPLRDTVQLVEMVEDFAADVRVIDDRRGGAA
ncbi:hypothetical protein [Frankia sp. Cas3]|uniref:hypothetical protein n=1 Tax=Frankia sp. Cas3 TaxID=3073926 RepID=UPI002AD45EB6|nr:hypothetical protein [Frankia sp. Cas3]